MPEQEDYKFTLELPEKIIYKMKPIDLPPNMRIQYEKYLESNEDKDSKTFQTLKRRQKYLANMLVLQDIIRCMIEKDMSFDDAYANIYDTIDEVLGQVDSFFGRLFKEEESTKLFKDLFHNVFKLMQKIDSNTEIDISNKIFIGIKDIQGKLVGSLDGYGISKYVAEILKDEDIVKDIEVKYVKPIQGILKEYLALFMEENEEEYYDMFSSLFIQSNEFQVYQALMNVLVALAIEKNTNISGLLKDMDKKILIDQSKEMILGYIGIEEYKEEIEKCMKLLIEEKAQY